MSRELPSSAGDGTGAYPEVAQSRDALIGAVRVLITKVGGDHPDPYLAAYEEVETQVEKLLAALEAERERVRELSGRFADALGKHMAELRQRDERIEALEAERDRWIEQYQRADAKLAALRDLERP